MGDIIASQTRLRRSKPRVAAVRAGSVYVLVLGMAGLLTVIGLGALAVSRIDLRAGTASADRDEAGVLAAAGMEHALACINADPAWRWTYANNTWTAPVPLGGGTFQWKFVDEADGSLSDDAIQPVRLFGRGQAGGATRLFSVALLPSQENPLDCLETAITVQSSISFNSSTVEALGLPVASNLSMNCNTAMIAADLEAVGSIQPNTATITGTVTPGAAARRMPDAGVFDYYRDRSTPIPIEVVPLVGGVRTLSRRLLGPAHNPFGNPNPLGIYSIDCKGQKIVLSACRIVGTVVLLNPGASSLVDANCNWVPAVANYPCLLVKGNMTFDKDSTGPLAESASPAANFNPPGAPYPFPYGETNGTSTDSYPCEMAGLVYVSGNVSMTSTAVLRVGLLLAGGSYAGGSSRVIVDWTSVYARTPPPGFGAGAMTIADGSWRWEVNP